MIRVTIWNEYVQEQLDVRVFPFQENLSEKHRKWGIDRAVEIKAVHTSGAIHDTLKGIMDEPSDEELKKAIADKKFYCIHGKHCMYCASKDICLEHGAYAGGE